MKKHEAFPGKYLKTADLDGKPRLYTIARITSEEISGDEEKPVAHFAEGDAMVLNATKWDVLEHLYGAESDDWIGKNIVVYASTTRFQGKTVPCMALRAPKVTKAAPPPASPEETENSGAEMDDEIPF